MIKKKQESMAYSKEQNKLASLSLTKSFTRQILLNSLKYSQRAKEKHEKKNYTNLGKQCIKIISIKR